MPDRSGVDADGLPGASRLRETDSCLKRRGATPKYRWRVTLISADSGLILLLGLFDQGTPIRDAQKWGGWRWPATLTWFYDDNREDLAGKAASKLAASV